MPNPTDNVFVIKIEKLKAQPSGRQSTASFVGLPQLKHDHILLRLCVISLLQMPNPTDNVFVIKIESTA